MAIMVHLDELIICMEMIKRSNLHFLLSHTRLQQKQKAALSSNEMQVLNLLKI